MELKYQTTVRYLFILLTVGTILLKRLGYISSFLEYLLLSVTLLATSLLILFKKYYFISNLISHSSTVLTDFEVKLGKVTGIITFIISIIFFLLALKNK